MNSTQAWELYQNMRKCNPLVQCITNYVSMDIMANILLASGASPAMLHGIKEIEEFAAITTAISINIGTLDPDWLESMRQVA